MPNIGIPELLIVLVIIVFIFGASRLTDIMGALGRGVREFRAATSQEPTEASRPADTERP